MDDGCLWDQMWPNNDFDKSSLASKFQFMDLITCSTTWHCQSLQQNIMRTDLELMVMQAATGQLWTYDTYIALSNPLNTETILDFLLEQLHNIPSSPSSSTTNWIKNAKKRNKNHRDLVSLLCSLLLQLSSFRLTKQLAHL